MRGIDEGISIEKMTVVRYFYSVALFIPHVILIFNLLAIHSGRPSGQSQNMNVAQKSYIHQNTFNSRYDSVIYFRILYLSYIYPYFLS